jgi:hypothetical protein
MKLISLETRDGIRVGAPANIIEICRIAEWIAIAGSPEPKT